MKKIIHIDMDCFFAAVEMRDNPRIKNEPVAVGGMVEQRGVLSTCNYEARKHGLHSAMSTAQAFKLCPKLVLFPVNMPKYKAASEVLYSILRQYTPLVEMLSLDEAFLDVTCCKCCKGSATLIARTIKMRIKKELRLTSSAGIAPNKFLAKVASDWNKPDGLFVITPDQIDDFVRQLSVTKIYGVGKVIAKKLHDIRVRTCNDLQALPLQRLTEKFGKVGERFYYLCRGIDYRNVEPEYIRKSLSTEKTYPKDLKTVEECCAELKLLIQKLRVNLFRINCLKIAKKVVKIKFCDFKVTTAETTGSDIADQGFFNLFKNGYDRNDKKPIRLLGVGVKFGKIK